MAKERQSQVSEEANNLPPIQTVQEIESAHPDEWVEIEITTMADDGVTPVEGRLMAHGENQDELNKKAKQYRKDHVVHSSYRNYIGEMKAEAVLL